MTYRISSACFTDDALKRMMLRMHKERVRLKSVNSPMLATERLLVVTVDGANLGHALQRLCNLAPLHSSEHCVSYELRIQNPEKEVLRHR